MATIQHIDDDDDEQYESSQDSDFAPDTAPAAASDQSESEAEDDEPKQKKRAPVGEPEAGDAGYDNSGDEAIIERGLKRRKKGKGNDAIADDDEGGEGGLIKTRSQRAAEKEERKYAASTGPVTIDVDAMWAQMLAGKPATAPSTETMDIENDADTTREGVAGEDKSETQPKPSETEDSNMIRIKRTYNFAGQVHTEEKLVARDSAEAKLFLASQGEADASSDAAPAKRKTKKAFRSAFEPIFDPLPQRADLNLGMAARIKAGKEAQAKKLNTVQKSRMDWAGYVDKEGIKDELELAGKSKESYAARQDFLARSEAKRDDDARRVRLAGKA
ncbi:bucentaur or craniofacial development-domain-containing protein [Stachybotrys elegans]|uniref:SWR1-complex protein 5 n=1 Tax=Stachybotrys elegans TaxID=80388 RepID=A0A8K0WW95_9HYPO|nr:bucentaur or craniofacial development-domain-containing protein [Stachybotrys elegans]